MAVFKPFAAVRPVPELAERVAALPYDVMNREEAWQMAEGNPYSFLHVDRAEIDLDPSVDPYDPQVYRKAADNLEGMIRQGVLRQDAQPCFYLYRQVMDGRAQTGVVGCASIDDYLENHIKKHELTREEKEQDRIRHVDVCGAHTGPIFLTCRPQEGLDQTVAAWSREHAPVYDFTAEDGIRHTVWVVDDPETIEKMEEAFGEIPDFYIADGHHRAASAVKVGQMRRERQGACTGEEAFLFFLAVLFPSDQLSILDYNRVATDLGGLTEAEFLRNVGERFEVSPLEGMARPAEKHTIHLYLGGRWYRLRAKDGTFRQEDPVERLDVSILQRNLLAPVLGIEDPRTDPRIQFVGGVRGLEELVRLVDGGMGAAFAMYPTTLEDLMDIADSGNIMPPKSTWFEPKLRSGLFVHPL